MFWLHLGPKSQNKNQNSRENSPAANTGAMKHWKQKKQNFEKIIKRVLIWYPECFCDFLWDERIYHWHHYLTEITWHSLDMLKTCILSWTDEIDNNLKIMEDDCHGDIWQVDVGQFSVLPVGLLRKFLPQHLFWICGNVKVCPSFSVSNHSNLIKSYKNKLQGKMPGTNIR